MLCQKPYNAPVAPVAQLDRALPSEGRGQQSFLQFINWISKASYPNLLRKAACHTGVTAKGDGLWLQSARGGTNGKHRSEEEA